MYARRNTRTWGKSFVVENKLELLLADVASAGLGNFLLSVLFVFRSERLVTT